MVYSRLRRGCGLIDPKLGTLAHRDVGQMHVRDFDRHAKAESEDAAAGIVRGWKKERSFGRNHLAC